MHIWDIFENLMNTFLGIEGWGWGGDWYNDQN